MLVDLAKEQKKPIVVVLETGLAEAERMKLVSKFLAAQVPVFPTLPRAARAIAHMSRYSAYLKAISS